MGFSSESRDVTTGTSRDRENKRRISQRSHDQWKDHGLCATKRPRRHWGPTSTKGGSPGGERRRRGSHVLGTPRPTPKYVGEGRVVGQNEETGD